MDTMYEYFYLTTLIAAILSGLVSIISSIICKRPSKFWRRVIYGLLIITVVAMIGFVVTIPWRR